MNTDSVQSEITEIETFPLGKDPWNMIQIGKCPDGYIYGYQFKYGIGGICHGISVMHEVKSSRQECLKLAAAYILDYISGYKCKESQKIRDSISKLNLSETIIVVQVQSLQLSLFQ